MIDIYVSNPKDYRINAAKIKARLKSFISSKKSGSNISLSVAIVDDTEMAEIAQKYLHEGGVVHNVLSFPEAEVGGYFAYPNDGVLRLGDIVVCYPRAFEEAKLSSEKVAERLYYLIEHGAKHLLGEHHK